MRSFSLSDGYSERIIYRQREDRFPMTLILHLSIGVGEKETAAKNPSLHMDNVRVIFLNIVLQGTPFLINIICIMIS